MPGFKIRLRPQEELKLMVTLVSGLFGTGLYNDIAAESVIADAQKILDALMQRTERNVEAAPDAYSGTAFDEMPTG